MMTVAHRGHVKLARKSFDPDHGDPLWLEQREFSKWEAWIDVLQLSAFRARKHVNAIETLDLCRGEFVASLRFLADRWTWTVKKVRTWLVTLEKWARIKAQRKTQAGTVYLIVNYERYQSGQADEDTAEGTPDGTPRAHRGHKKEAVKQLSTPAAAEKISAAWVTAIGDVWSAEVGRIQYGRIGKDLKPLHDQHGTDRLLRAVRAYIARQKSSGGSMKWSWFVEQSASWVERSTVPLTVIDGEMTPELEARTRPAIVRRIG